MKLNSITAPILAAGFVAASCFSPISPPVSYSDPYIFYSLAEHQNHRCYTPLLIDGDTDTREFTIPIDSKGSNKNGKDSNKSTSTSTQQSSSVAVLSTGVTDERVNATGSQDCQGTGTFIAGTIAAKPSNTDNYLGYEPGAHIESYYYPAINYLKPDSDGKITGIDIKANIQHLTKIFTDVIRKHISVVVLDHTICYPVDMHLPLDILHQALTDFEDKGGVIVIGHASGCAVLSLWQGIFSGGIVPIPGGYYNIISTDDFTITKTLPLGLPRIGKRFTAGVIEGGQNIFFSPDSIQLAALGGIVTQIAGSNPNLTGDNIVQTLKDSGAVIYQNGQKHYHLNPALAFLRSRMQANIGDVKYGDGSSVFPHQVQKFSMINFMQKIKPAVFDGIIPVIVIVCGATFLARRQEKKKARHATI